MLERIRELNNEEIAIHTAILYLQNKLKEVQNERQKLIQQLCLTDQLHTISETLDHYLDPDSITE
jgi:hypothetical protein